MDHAVVQLDKVEKDYGRDGAVLHILQDINLSINKGEFMGVIGASGSGKTTLLNILGCLDRPTRGRYLLNGQDISTLEDDRLSAVRNESIGFVFQSFNLIPQLTVLENVEIPLFYKRIPKSKRKEKSLTLLKAVGLSHRLGHYPTQLSGGECQRVSIARALVNDPMLLLADEPTGNLDSKNGAEVMKLFYELHATGRTILMVTHNPEVAAILPRVVEFRDGRVLRETRREEAEGRRGDGARGGYEILAGSSGTSLTPENIVTDFLLKPQGASLKTSEKER